MQVYTHPSVSTGLYFNTNGKWYFVPHCAGSAKEIAAQNPKRLDRLSKIMEPIVIRSINQRNIFLA